MHTSLLSKTKLTLIAAVLLVAPLAFGAGTASAAGSGTTSYVNDIGPCATDWIDTYLPNGVIEEIYPLPGAGHVRMLHNGAVSITLRGLCTEPGWTATGKNVSGGVQATFTGPNGAGVDFKYVFGKTDIRYR